MKRLLLLSLALAACNPPPLHKRTPPKNFSCVPYGWSLVSVGPRILLSQGVPEAPTIFWDTDTRWSGHLYIEAGADERCPAPPIPKCCLVVQEEPARDLEGERIEFEEVLQADLQEETSEVEPDC